MKVEDLIQIDAPPSVVWAVTEDVERWPEWTPTVTSVKRLDDGAFGLGSRALIKQPAQPEREWEVTEYDPERRFAWSTCAPGLRMTGRHELIAVGGGTLNRLTVEAAGALAVLLWPVLRIAMRSALGQENAGLKRRAEVVARSKAAAAADGAAVP